MNGEQRDYFGTYGRRTDRTADATAAPVDRRRFRASALNGAAGVEASQLVAADPEDLLMSTSLDGI